MSFYVFTYHTYIDKIYACSTCMAVPYDIYLHIGEVDETIAETIFAFY